MVQIHKILGIYEDTLKLTKIIYKKKTLADIIISGEGLNTFPKIGSRLIISPFATIFSILGEGIAITREQEKIKGTQILFYFI